MRRSTSYWFAEQKVISKIAELISETDGIQRFAPDFVTGDIHEGFGFEARSSGLYFQKFCEKAKQGIAFIGTDDILGRRKSRLGNFKRRLLPQQKQVDQLLDFQNSQMAIISYTSSTEWEYFVVYVT